MFHWFRKKEAAPATGNFSFLGCDLHNHLMPGIDDGSPDLGQTLRMAEAFAELGFRKIISTPHVHGDFYPNDRQTIQNTFAQAQPELSKACPEMAFGIAAEYYLDPYFREQVLPHGLLSFGRDYVLTEVAMAGWPHLFDELLFEIQSAGYRPILAHPERYIYEQDPDFFARVRDKGVLLQLNLLALTGYYGRSQKVMAGQLLKRGLYSFCGTDAHHDRHFAALRRMAADRPMMRALQEYDGFLNNTL